MGPVRQLGRTALRRARKAAEIVGSLAIMPVLLPLVPLLDITLRLAGVRRDGESGEEDDDEDEERSHTGS